MILAALLLLSGLSISAVAIYYSVVGLTAIFSAAAVPIMIMGISLEVGKLVIASWVKAYWSRIPILMRTYAVAGVAVLMIITSLGIFGFLSKAHSDQTLVSGDVQSKIAVYDEKIKTEKENIEADRKALKQLDEAVDQILGRSTTETGADRAVAIRRSQQKERTRIQAEILQSQQSISQLNDARAPIAAEVRKVEAEVGPIKYIAAFVYGDNPDASILERAVTWVIILIVIVFDPLAVVMLLAAQMTWYWYRNPESKSLTWEQELDATANSDSGYTVDELIEQEQEDNTNNETVDESAQLNETPPAYLFKPFEHFKDLKPMPAPTPEPEPVLKTTPFEVVENAPNWTLINGEKIKEVEANLNQAVSDLTDLARYTTQLQQDYAAVTELNQRSMERETALATKADTLQEDLNNAIGEIIALRTQQTAGIATATQPNQDSDDQAIDVEVGSQRTEPLIKALEGKEAYNLMKDIGIFTEDGKLAYEYGGQEDDVQEDSASEASMAPISQPEPQIQAVGIDVTDRPGDYITDSVANLLSRRQPTTGFGNNFPNDPERGDLYVRTDFKPSKLFKWNGAKWLQISKDSTDVYAYNEAYIKFLAEQILAGVYNWEDLTAIENEQVNVYFGAK